MSDAVSIASIASGGVLGLAGIVSAGYYERSRRRWQSSEERVTDLRAVFDRVGVALSDTILALGEAHWAADEAVARPEAKPQLRKQGWEAEQRSRAARAALRAAVKRLSIRRGADDEIADVLHSVNEAINDLADAVKDELQEQMDETRYQEAWCAVEKAEDALYVTTEDVLRSPEAGGVGRSLLRRGRRRQLPRSHPDAR